MSIVLVEEPLSLECSCPEVAGTQCALIALEVVSSGAAGVGFTASTISGGPGGAELSLSVGAETIQTPGPVADWLAALPGLCWTFAIDRSLFSFENEASSAQVQIRGKYSCGDVDDLGNPKYYYINANPLMGGGDECSLGGIRSFVLMYPGNAFGVQFFSTPLGACNGSSVTGCGWTSLDPITLKAGQSAGDWCLCATGGSYYIDTETSEVVTPPQRSYSIAEGRLASGLTLDPDTGCLTGEADDQDPGTPTITFRVLDELSPTGAYADVTCGFTQDGCVSRPTLMGNHFR